MPEKLPVINCACDTELPQSSKHSHAATKAHDITRRVVFSAGLFFNVILPPNDLLPYTAEVCFRAQKRHRRIGSSMRRDKGHINQLTLVNVFPFWSISRTKPPSYAYLVTTPDASRGKELCSTTRNRFSHLENPLA